MAPPSFPPGISVQITVFVAEENVGALFDNLKPIFDSVTALPGCTFFEIYQSPEDPGEISWVENWTVPVEDVLAHIQQEKYKQYFEGAEKLFLKPRVVKVLNRLGEGNTHVRKENGGFKE